LRQPATGLPGSPSTTRHLMAVDPRSALRAGMRVGSALE